MAGNSTEAGRSVTNKITSILMTFTEGSEHSLTEIAQLARLPTSTAHRLTSELASWRLLERTSEGRYRAGLPLRTMGVGDIHPPDLNERAPCVLEDLAQATHCRARLGVLREIEIGYIEKQPGMRPVTVFAPRATLPAHASALGRVLLAFAPPSTIEMIIMQGLRAYTPHTITSPDRLRRVLALTRAARIAFTNCELEATSCAVAVPVFGPSGSVVAAIELTVPELGHTMHPVLAALSVAARSLSRELAETTRDLRAPPTRPRTALHQTHHLRGTLAVQPRR